MEKIEHEIQYETLVEDVSKEDAIKNLLVKEVKKGRVLKLVCTIESIFIAIILLIGIIVFSSYDVKTVEENVITTETYGFDGDFEQYNDNSSNNSGGDP